LILVDTSVWVDHLRRGNALVGDLLGAGQVLIHPFVIGEVALGERRQRKAILAALSDLPRAQVATDGEAMSFIASHGLYGRGVGYVAVRLLAAVRLTAGAALWTNDRRLRAIADSLGSSMKQNRES
jgi:predicted nucleic acid-binding protein